MSDPLDASTEEGPSKTAVEYDGADELQLARKLMIEGERRLKVAERIHSATVAGLMVAAMVVAITSLSGDVGDGYKAITTTGAGWATITFAITQLITSRNAMERHKVARDAGSIAHEISRHSRPPTKADIETWRTRRLQVSTRM